MISERKNIHVLLADDDSDERLFFSKALKELPIGTSIETVPDGERLLQYLRKSRKSLPDILFLDINMPRKYGTECLKEIKADKDLKGLPVIMYSTSLMPETVSQYYKNGAHYYVKKPEGQKLKKVLKGLLARLALEKFKRPPINEFIVTLA